MAPDPVDTNTSRRGDPGAAAAAATVDRRSAPPLLSADTSRPTVATWSLPADTSCNAAIVDPSGDQKNPTTPSGSIVRTAPDAASISRSGPSGTPTGGAAALGAMNASSSAAGPKSRAAVP